MERHHLPELLIVQGVDGVQPETGGEDPVESRRAATALNVTKDRGPGFLPCAVGNFGLQQRSDAGQAYMSEGVDFAGARGERSFDRQGAFSDHDNGRVMTGETMFNELTHVVDVEGPLRYEYHIRSARNSRVPGDPTSMTTHDLNDEDAMMALCRGVKPINRLGRDHHGGVEPERVIGRAQIVVDGLGYPDHGETARRKFGRYSQRVLSPDDDKGLYAKPAYGVEHPALTILGRVRIGPTGSKDGPASRQDTADGRHVQRHGIPFQEAAPAVTEPYKFITMDLDAFADNRPDDRIQTRAIAAAGQYTYAHGDERIEDVSSDAPGGHLSPGVGGRW